MLPVSDPMVMFRFMSKDEVMQLLTEAYTNADIYRVRDIRNALLAEGPRNVWSDWHYEAARYAERYLGVLIRRAQTGPDAWITSRDLNIRSREVARDRDRWKPVTELVTWSDARYIYQLVDDVDDEQFEAAMNVCRAQNTFARGHLIIALDKEGPHWTRRRTDRPEILRRTRRVQVDGVMNTSINTLYGVFDGLDSVLTRSDFSVTDPELTLKWANELDEIIGRARKWRNVIRKVADDQKRAEQTHHLAGDDLPFSTARRTLEARKEQITDGS